MAVTIDPAVRKRVLRVVFVSLLLDLVRSMRTELCFILYTRKEIPNKVIDFFYFHSTPLS